MRFTREIGIIKDLQSQHVKTEEDIHKECSKLEKDVHKVVLKKLEEAFPTINWKQSFSWSVCTDGGCLTNKWQPEVYFYSVNECNLSPKGFWYNYSNGEKVKPPLNTRQFISFLKEISEELDVTCRMIKEHPYFVYQRD